MKWFASCKKKISQFRIFAVKECVIGSRTLNTVCLSILITVAFAPFLFLVWYFFSMQDKSQAIDRSMKRLESKKGYLQKIYLTKELYQNQYGKSDCDYLKHYVEHCTFLKRDTDLLKKFFHEYDESEYTLQKERLQHLKGSGNMLSFKKVWQNEGKEFTERCLKAERSVEVDSFDIKRLLSLLEGVKIEENLPNPFRPQLIIRKFELKSLSDEVGEGVFSLNLEVLQRDSHEKVML